MPSADANPPKRGTATALSASIGRSLTRIRLATGSALAFGGRVDDDGVVLDHFDGEVVGPLRGVYLEPGHGLGGRVVAQRRSLAVPDYVANSGITHRYDEIIRAERLRALAAVPVVVARRPVAVLYASHRTPLHGLDRVLDVVADEARALEQELAVTAAVRTPDAADPGSEGRLRSRVRDTYSELRTIAAAIEDERLRAVVRAAAERLVRGSDEEPAPAGLTQRERDVLALIAAGLSDRRIAAALNVGVYTVKGHVKNLLAKLHAANRYEAVAVARRRQLLP